MCLKNDLLNGKNVDCSQTASVRADFKGLHCLVSMSFQRLLINLISLLFTDTQESLYNIVHYSTVLDIT